MESTEHKIMRLIWEDIIGRSGGDGFLGNIDDEIQSEIKAAWMKIIKDALE